jgi:hypothetical protein
MPAGWAALAAGAIGAVGSVVAGGEQAGADENAAQTQQNMFNTIVGQEQPFLQGGYGAENELTQLTGASPATGPGGTAAGTGLQGGYLTQTFDPTQSQLANYPGYQFQLQQGDLAVSSANSAGGSAVSGPALKSLMSFNQGLAASNYQNYFNQFQTQQNNIFNRLSGIASMGQNAAGNLGSAGASLGTGVAQAQAAAGAATAGGIVGSTNNIGQSILLSNLMNPSVDPGFTPQDYGTMTQPGFGSPGTMDAGGGYTFTYGGS